MVILVTGGRFWNKKQVIESVLLNLYQKLGDDVVIVQGDCKGADLMAKSIARDIGWKTKDYPAPWNRQPDGSYDKSAGPKRNRQMFNSEHPDLVIAFHQDISKSVGTKDMVRYSLEQGCAVLYYNGQSDHSVSLPTFMLRWFKFI